MAIGGVAPARAAEAPTPELFRVLEPQAEGPRITPYLTHQLERAWAFDAARQERFARVETEADLRTLQDELRRKALAVIGGLPAAKTPLNARVTGTIPMDGYRVDKLVFESLPGDPRHRPRLRARRAGGEEARGAAGLRALADRQGPPAATRRSPRASRGAGTSCSAGTPSARASAASSGTRARGRSRYNLVCGEHAVLGNFATIAGTSLVRYMVWDGMRAVDYLLTRDDVDAEPARDHRDERRRLPGALDRRPRPAHRASSLPSCFPTALPMRMANRIFEDPDSDPEQDPPGLVSEGIDHPGLLLLAYPRPLHVSAAVLDFFPIEGTRKTMREVAALLPALRARGPRRAQRGLPQAPVLGREPGEGVRLPRPRLRPAGSGGPRRREDARARGPAVHADAARCARTWPGARWSR